MCYKVFRILTPWAPSDYFNIAIPQHNLHYVHHDFNIRKPLCRTNIFANDFLTVASLHGIVCLFLSLIQSLLLCLSFLLIVSVDTSTFLVYAVYDCYSYAECNFTC